MAVVNREGILAFLQKYRKSTDKTTPFWQKYERNEMSTFCKIILEFMINYVPVVLKHDISAERGPFCRNAEMKSRNAEGKS